MSMNFAREQSLLRQRLLAVGSPAHAEACRLATGSSATFLGADDEAIRAAASDLAAAHPQMGRAQMTAFVRTLWQSRVHELRAVGVELLAQRAALLEPADLPFLETLLQDNDAEPFGARLAGEVLGALVAKSKKLWKDLRRLAAAPQPALQRAAVRACRLPLLGDSEAFGRCAELVEPLLATADAALLGAIDELLAAAATVHRDAVLAFADRTGRTIAVPRTPPAPPAPSASAAPETPAVPLPRRRPAAKPPSRPATARAQKPGGKRGNRAPAKKQVTRAARKAGRPAARKRAARR
ncbi:MAG: DNA alkylation repair protein [Planctomycetes bacterium]|nr:DNA alkylation repair protein [Planctomycetota bacterium]